MELYNLSGEAARCLDLRSAIPTLCEGIATECTGTWSPTRCPRGAVGRLRSVLSRCRPNKALPEARNRKGPCWSPILVAVRSCGQFHRVQTRAGNNGSSIAPLPILTIGLAGHFRPLAGKLFKLTPDLGVTGLLCKLLALHGARSIIVGPFRHEASSHLRLGKKSTLPYVIDQFNALAMERGQD
jgi:hypothetical protein